MAGHAEQLVEQLGTASSLPYSLRRSSRHDQGCDAARVPEEDVRHSPAHDEQPATEMSPPAEQVQGTAEPAFRARPRWTLSEAADRVGVSRSTLRRRREAGAFPHAEKDGDGAWTVSVEDLLGAGFTLARAVVDPRAAEQAQASAPTSEASRTSEQAQNGAGQGGSGSASGAAQSPLSGQAHPEVSGAAQGRSEQAQQVEALVSELQRTRVELARAQAQAEERGRALDDVRLALRALTASASSSAPERSSTPFAAPAAPSGGVDQSAHSDAEQAQDATSSGLSSVPATSPRRRWWQRIR